MQKKTYKRPSLRVYGLVQDVTLMMATGAAVDMVGMAMMGS